MSGYGWNASSGYGNPNGFNFAPSTQEQCVVCHQVVYSTEALINHYETHIREDDLLNFCAIVGRRNFPNHNNPLQQPYLFPNVTQVASHRQAQRRFATLTANTVIQQREMMHRRQNLAALNNGNMIVTRPAPGAAVAQPNDQAAAAGAIPDETELDFRDGKINRSSSTDGSINLDLTLGTP